MKIKRSYVLGILSVVVILLCVIWILSRYEVKNTPPKNDTIIAFGDSLVVGVGSTNGGGFVTLLEDAIGTQIENRGVSGNTTRDALLRLEQDVVSKNPGIVFVLLGGNDFLKKIPKEETFDNLRTIITSIQDSGAVTVLLGVRGGILSDEYEDDFEELARETGSVYVPNVLDGIIGNGQYMYDAIHPNDLGYSVIADKVFQEIEFLF